VSIDPEPSEKRRTRAAEDTERDEMPRPAAERRSRGSGGIEFDAMPPEVQVAPLATSQRGIVTAAQLSGLGLTRHQVARAVRLGRLHRLHRGVFAVGHTALAPFAREYAALLASGEGALLSHISAAHVHGLLDAPPIPDVTVVGRAPRRQDGIQLHYAAALDPRDRRLRQGMPVTTVARTIVDLAAVLTASQLERILGEAYAQRLATEAAVRAALDRAAGRRGTAVLRGLLGAATSAVTRSEAERRALAVIRRAGLPRPLTNIRVAGHEVDLLWREHRLIVEIDGYAFHGHRKAFERDRRRDAALLAAGYRVMRITWRQLTEEPLALVANLARALAHGTDAAGY
jgi:very-short-patch-repair endonuclease